MAQTISAGNNNSFDLDAIKAQADRMEQGVARVADERDPADLAIEAEAEELTDDILNNPSTNRADEAQAFLNRPAATKLSSGSVLAIQAAMQLQSEKSTNGFDRRNADDVWNDRKDRDEKERKDQAKIADMADDMQNAQQLSTKPDRYGLSEQNYSDLNDQLKTRDGQERMMAFLRMMYPNKTDAERAELLQNMTLIARAESPEGTAEDRRAVETLDPAKAAEARGAMSSAVRFQKGQSVTPEAAPPTVVVASNDSRNADTTAISVAGRQARLEGGFESAPPLRANFAAANVATAPLDAPAARLPRPEIASIASVQPVQPPAPSGSGFDV